MYIQSLKVDYIGFLAGITNSCVEKILIEKFKSVEFADYLKYKYCTYQCNYNFQYNFNLASRIISQLLIYQLKFFSKRKVIIFEKKTKLQKIKEKNLECLIKNIKILKKKE